MYHHFLKLFFVCLFALSSQLHAYTDPGSGTLIWQLLMASFVDLLFTLKGSLHGLLNFRKSAPTKNENSFNASLISRSGRICL